MVTPASCTGRNLPTGVSDPILPTCTSIFSTTVSACCALNLYAIAQRGDRDTSPSCSCERVRVHLGDDAVGLVVELVALFGDLVPVFEDRVDPVADARQRIDAESQRLDALEKIPLRLERSAFDHAGGVKKSVERPRRRDLRIELPQSARRRVARIGEHRLAGLVALLVQLRECGARKNHLAAHLEDSVVFYRARDFAISAGCS